MGAVDNTEIGYLNGVTSNIQAQLNAKQNSDADLNLLAAPTAWRLFYSNGSSAITELPLGSSGQYLQSNGAAVAPSWSVPTGAGDMLRATYDTNADGAVDIAAGGTGAKTATGARTALGLGTMSTQNADNVAITGGSGTFSNLGTVQGTNPGELRLFEGSGSGTEYRGWGVAGALADNIVFRIPTADPTANAVMLFAAPSGDNAAASWGTFDAGDFQVSGGTISIKALGVDVAQINATGTPASTNTLRGDGTWGAPPLTDNTVNGGKIQDNTITGAKLAFKDSLPFGLDNVVVSLDNNTWVWPDVPAAITIDNVVGYASTDNVVCRLAWCAGDNVASCTDITSSDMTVTNATAPPFSTATFSDATIPAGSWIKLKITSVGTTNSNRLYLGIRYTVD